MRPVTKLSSSLTIIGCSIQLTPLLNRYVVPGRGPRVNLPRARQAQFRAVVDFFPIGNPPGHAYNGKHDREHIYGQADGAQNNARIEVHIRVEVALDEVGVAECDFFKLTGNVEQRVIYLEEL